MGAELARLVGGVPALHDAVELVRPLVGRVASEPRRLDHAAALRRRGLLVLAGEIIFADPRDKPGDAADLLEHFRRLALGMQCLAAASDKIPRPPQRLDLPGLVFLGDCREAHDVPIFLGQHVADQIVPRVKPEGRLSCSRCMITTIFPFRLSFSRL